MDLFQGGPHIVGSTGVVEPTTQRQRLTGASLVDAMKGMSWESPRGPISIDPQTRDIIQNIYIRKVEKKNGQLYNVEFQTFEAVKDFGKIKK